MRQVSQQPPGVLVVLGIQDRGQHRGRLPRAKRSVVTAGHDAFQDGAQQVPLAAPVGVQALHRDVGPVGDADYGGRRVASLGELGLGGGE